MKTMNLPILSLLLGLKFNQSFQNLFVLNFTDVRMEGGFRLSFYASNSRCLAANNAVFAVHTCDFNF